MSDHNLAEALRRIQSNLMHQRRFGVDDMGHWRRAATQAEGDIEGALRAHEAEQQAGEAVAYALLFPGDPRLCLSTVFDTYTEAINYVVTRVSGPAEIVPLFTHPQQPLSDEQEQPPIARVMFPTMLRKMWSGDQVQRWLDEHVNGITKK